MSPHRLDLATSGIVIFARNLDSLKNLQGQFRERSVEKRYTAVISGKIDDAEGSIDLPIGKDTIQGPPCFAIDHTLTGKPAHTKFKIAEIAEAKMETKHQDQ